MSKAWLVREMVGLEYRDVSVSDLKIHKGNTPELYHISFDNKLPKVLVPRLPYGSDSSSEKNVWHSEPDIPRVSFSDSLTGAVRGIFANIVDSLDLTRDITVNVYRLVGDKRVRLVSPDVLVSSGSVHDALLTTEWWALDPVRIERVGKVTIRFDTKGEWIKYRPFGNVEEKEHSPKNITVL